MSGEVKKSFIEYSMSVITSRALPDVRDGMKPPTVLSISRQLPSVTFLVVTILTVMPQYTALW